MLQVMYGGKYLDVLKYIGKGDEVKYYFKVMSNHLRLGHVFFFPKHTTISEGDM